MKCSIGIDLGGTNIRIAIVNENGDILEVIKERTVKGNTLDIANQIVSLYERIDKKDYNIVGIGIGVPGTVTPDNIVTTLPNLNIFEVIDFKSLLKDRINLPIYVGNDANVACLGEAKVGNGKGYDIVQFVTLSTGIGGGLCINGKLHIGKSGFANEVGAMLVNKNGSPCNDKPNGCIEGEASGTSLVNKAFAKGIVVNHAGELFELSKTNKVAKEICDDFKEYVSMFLASIYSYIEPDIFILGGGLMQSSDYFFDDIVKRTNELVVGPLKGNVKISKTAFDQDSGIIGAAMLAF